MTFLPIVERELRVAAKKAVTYWTRVLAAAVASAVTVWLLATLGTVVAPDLLGPRMFRTLASLAFLGSLFSGVVLTADCLSEEKREGTLGFLFLTDLTGYDVVLGKLMGRSLRAFYGLLAISPMLAVPFFVGGLTAGEFWRVVAVLANTLFFSLAAGMCVSAASRQEYRAMLATVAMAIVAGFVVPSLGGWFAMASPSTMFRLAFEASFVSVPKTFLAVLCVVLRTARPGAFDWMTISTGLWLMIGGANAYLFYAYSDHKLATEFRLRAAVTIRRGPWPEESGSVTLGNQRLARS